MLPDKKITRVLFFFIILHGALLFFSPLLPFTDLPNHLAEAMIYKYGSSGSMLGDYYERVPWFYPNTFHAFFCSFFPSVELGNKFFYLIYAAALVLSVDRIIKFLGGNRWYGLFSIFFIYNFNTVMGFSGFTMAIPALLFLFYFSLLEMQYDSFRYTVIIAALMFLLYLMHAQVALLGLVLYACLLLYRFGLKWKKLAGKIGVVLLPVIILVAVWWKHRAPQRPEESTATYLFNYYKTAYWKNFPLRFLLLFYDHLGLVGLKRAAWITPLVLLPIVPFIYFKVWKKISLAWLKQEKAIPLLIFLGISCCCYIFLPDELPGQAPLYTRFCTLVWIGIVLVGSVCLRGITSRFFKWLCLSSILAYSVLWIEYIYSFNKENKGFNAQFFSMIPADAKLGGLIYDYQYRSRGVYIHFPGYFIVWKKGLAVSKMIDYRFGIVRRGQKGNEIPFFPEWIGMDFPEKPAYKDSVQYILVRGEATVMPDPNLLHFEPGKTTGKWMLWRNTYR